MNLTPLALFAMAFAALLAGYPVALTLAGVALIFAFVGTLTGAFNPADLGFAAGRLFGIITNQTLIAVPLFVFMGVLLEKTRIAEDLLSNLSNLLGRYRGGLAITVILVGMLMAASTGIVGATVVTMGLMSLPIMLQRGYPASLATGTICATGTLGQIIPPSIALVLLGDVLSNGYQQAQLSMGIFAPKSISVGDLFAGAIIPGLCLVGLYLGYILVRVIIAPQSMPPAERADDVALAPVLGRVGTTTAADRRSTGFDFRRLRDTYRGRRRRCFRRPVVGSFLWAHQPTGIIRGRECHTVHHRHGVFHSRWRVDFFLGLSRLRRR
jgi:TRAP-type mannitol/chloroaromatic compound transport system permease large subunit